MARSEHGLLSLIPIEDRVVPAALVFGPPHLAEFALFVPTPETGVRTSPRVSTSAMIAETDAGRGGLFPTAFPARSLSGPTAMGVFVGRGVTAEMPFAPRFDLRLAPQAFANHFEERMGDFRKMLDARVQPGESPEFALRALEMHGTELLARGEPAPRRSPMMLTATDLPTSEQTLSTLQNSGKPYGHELNTGINIDLLRDATAISVSNNLTPLTGNASSLLLPEFDPGKATTNALPEGADSAPGTGGSSEGVTLSQSEVVETPEPESLPQSLARWLEELPASGLFAMDVGTLEASAGLLLNQLADLTAVFDEDVGMPDLISTVAAATILLGGAAYGVRTAPTHTRHAKTMPRTTTVFHWQDDPRDDRTR